MDSPTVLCIDDRPQVLELRKATLESHDYCVRIASSGYTAMKILEETSVAAVLLEFKLEGMDAEAVAYHIKQRFPHLPTILLSAYAEMPERILWLVDEYVMKSELPERLRPIIERVIARPIPMKPTTSHHDPMPRVRAAAWTASQSHTVTVEILRLHQLRPLNPSGGANECNRCLQQLRGGDVSHCGSACSSPNFRS